MEEFNTKELNNNTFDYKKHIVNKKELNKYIEKYHKGEIKKGYGIGVDEKVVYCSTDEAKVSYLKY